MSVKRWAEKAVDGYFCRVQNFANYHKFLVCLREKREDKCSFVVKVNKPIWKSH